jgi:hypothetical protein
VTPCPGTATGAGLRPADSFQACDLWEKLT